MIICGLDECGRGPLAGPLVAAGVILTGPMTGLADSKKLTEKNRHKIYHQLIKTGAVIKVEIISARQINNRGIGWANKEIFRKIIKQLEADKYIVDGNLKLGRIAGKTEKIKTLIKADNQIQEVMAASIVAKTIRDKMMREWNEKYPQYGWESNAGYGTKFHIQAIKKHGQTPLHRSVFVTTALRNHDNSSGSFTAGES
jgi:ribonuclease HII